MGSGYSWCYLRIYRGKKQPYKAELWASWARVAGLFQESGLYFVLETCPHVTGVYGLQVFT